MRRGSVGVLVATGITAALVAGCSSGGGSSGSASGGSAAIGAPGAVTGERSGNGAASTGKSEPAGTGSGLPTQIARGAVLGDRAIVYTADLDLRVKDATAAADRASNLATSAGGFLFAERTDGPRSVSLTLKVPSPRFVEVFHAVARLGTVTYSSESAADVTQQVVDLRSRVATARASIARVRALLAKATRIGQIVEIEGELTRREADLESVEGQLRVLSDQVSLSTIDVAFTAGQHVAPPHPATHHYSGFLGGLRRGWDAFSAAAVAVATAVGAVLPFAVLAVLVAAVVLWGRRTLRTRRDTTPSPS